MTDGRFRIRARKREPARTAPCTGHLARRLALLLLWGTTMLTAMDTQFIPTLRANRFLLGIGTNLGTGDEAPNVTSSETTDAGFMGSFY